MTTHLTKSGSVELVDSWGHGRAARARWAFTPATLIFDDGDGHYQAWRFRGDRTEAARLLARLWMDGRRDGGGDHIIAMHGSSVEVSRTPDDFWIDAGDEFKPALGLYPEVIVF